MLIDFQISGSEGDLRVNIVRRGRAGGGDDCRSDGGTEMKSSDSFFARRALVLCNFRETSRRIFAGEANFSAEVDYG